MADGSETIEMLMADGLQLNTINKHKIYWHKRSTKIFLDITLKKTPITYQGNIRQALSKI